VRKQKEAENRNNVVIINATRILPLCPTGAGMAGLASHKKGDVHPPPRNCKLQQKGPPSCPLIRITLHVNRLINSIIGCFIIPIPKTQHTITSSSPELVFNGRQPRTGLIKFVLTSLEPPVTSSIAIIIALLHSYYRSVELNSKKHRKGWT
jgi:hypothetical protein